MIEFQMIEDLLGRLPKPPGTSLPAGVSDEVLNHAEEVMTVKFPASLRKWLKISNGPCVGPGRILGVHTGQSSTDIWKTLDLYPQWKRKWLPVANDGCGNYYVMPASTNREIEPPVLFIDTSETAEKAAYVVASSFPRFLVFLFKRELKESGWPFRKEEVLAFDPNLKSYEDAPLPWNAQTLSTS